MYFPICETYLVQWCSRDVWLIGGGTSAMSICAFLNMLNLSGVVVFHRTTVNWMRGYICHRYMCSFPYVKLIWCSGVPEMYGQLEEGVHLPWVYVHSYIC